MPHSRKSRQGPPGAEDAPGESPSRAFAQRTRAEQLAAVLDDRIRSGSLRPGDRVGTLDSLRAESGFAYSTVSEAVRLVRDRGLLDVRPGRGGGLFVAETGPVVRMRHTLLSIANEPGAVADAIQLREHLELLIDVAAARHRTDSDIDDLWVHVAVMKAASTWEDFVLSNWALHERIAAICPNAMARAVYVGTLGHLATTSPRPGNTPDGYWENRLRLHVDLVGAIVAGDESVLSDIVTRHNTSS